MDNLVTKDRKYYAQLRPSEEWINTYKKVYNRKYC